jgi:excisionase family DNA binding protein
MSNWSVLNKEENVWTNSYPVREYYTVQEVAMVTGMGTTSIYSSIKRGTMKAYRVNGVVHVKHEDLIAYRDNKGSTEAYSIDDLVIEEYDPAAEAAEDMGAEFDEDVDDNDLDFLDA